MKTLKYNEIYLKNYDTLTDVLRHLPYNGLNNSTVDAELGIAAAGSCTCAVTVPF